MSDLRRSAEHEAAHAVAAVHLGGIVEAIHARSSGAGLTRFSSLPPQWSPAVTAAGDLWEAEFSRLPYVDAACSDLARLERTVGATGVWLARREARTILARHRADVLRLADRLQAHRSLTNVGGRLVAAPATTGARR